MTRIAFRVRMAALAGALAAAMGTSASATNGAVYEVTITNITRGQSFTPVLVATHRPGVRLFTLGQPAAPELAIVAEEGDVGPLRTRAEGSGAVLDIQTTSGLIGPGQSQTVRVRGGGHFSQVSAVAMLIPTNDAFLAVNGEDLPRGFAGLSVDSPAYDAGSERNDELCASIPGPFFVECGGPGGGGQPSGDEEGYVHVHAGIHGIGDLSASARDWRNPVARITVRRVH